MHDRPFGSGKFGYNVPVLERPALPAGMGRQRARYFPSPDHYKFVTLPRGTTCMSFPRGKHHVMVLVWPLPSNHDEIFPRFGMNKMGHQTLIEIADQWCDV